MRAREARVKIVQVCGFEAIPPDLAVLQAAETAREHWGEDLAEVDLEVSMQTPSGLPRPSDGLSGGTLQSMATVGASVDGVDATDPAALIGETGLLMAEENSVSGRAGCLTPATALGTAELRRFERAHLDFKISA